jgi:DnaJ-class molecular chaperone
MNRRESGPNPSHESRRVKNYFEILGVPTTADLATIKRAYRKLAQENHPDRNPDNREAEERFRDAAEAYDVLSDSRKRETYSQFGYYSEVLASRHAPRTETTPPPPDSPETQELKSTSKLWSSKNYYQVLDVSPNVVPDAIAKAAVKKLREFSVMELDVASLERKKREIIRAFIMKALSELGDPQKRKIYDRTIGIHKTTEPENTATKERKDEEKLKIIKKERSFFLGNKNGEIMSNGYDNLYEENGQFIGERNMFIKGSWVTVKFKLIVKHGSVQREERLD